MLKKEIRELYKEKREKISQDELEEKSLKIANNLLGLSIWEYSFYHLFLRIQHLKEVNTEYILHILNGKDKNVVISKSDFKTLEMQHFLLTDSTPIQLNKWKIPEPINGIEIKTEQLEVVFVPLLAFDKNGHRIGYGKGFYDRFLENCKPSILKIGLSFFEVEETLFEALPTDIPVDYCVTPEQVYEF
jgi:5-formyltetrahydrofolate cyclo-ligase